MVTSFFDRLRSYACLVAQFGVAIFEDFATVEFLTLGFKVLFHHVYVIFVHLVIHSGVFDDQNSKFMETSCDFIAFLLPAIFPFEEGLHIDDWRLL